MVDKVRLIDANALKRDLIDNWAFYSVLMKNALDRQPTIDPDSLRPKGRWINKPVDDEHEDIILPHCSECGTPHARERNFCNECGADMRGE